MAVSVTKEELHRLVEQLPDGEVIAAARFLEYLRVRQATQSSRSPCSEAAGTAQLREERAPFQYPTVDVSWEHVMGLIGLLPEVPAGDALADTEAIYDAD